jgi:hypothetical protein
MKKPTRLDILLDRFCISEDALKAKGFDDCVIGVDMGGCIVYDADKMIRKIMKEIKSNYNDAREYFEYNIAGAYVGDFTPIYIYRI